AITEILLDREADPLRGHLGAAAEDAGDAFLLEARPFVLEALDELVEELGRGEHALDLVPGGQDRYRLVDDVVLVGPQVFHPALLDDLDDPARVEINAKADGTPAGL